MRILVADDDPDARDLMTVVLGRLGYVPDLAEDGDAAAAAVKRALAAREPYDVLIADRRMPGLDGLELCRRVRGLAGVYTYVVILTADSSTEQALEGMEAGADDYLAKPVRPDMLRLRLIAARRVTDLHRRLRDQAEELTRLGAAEHALARRDALTGLPNRLALQEDLDRAAAQRERYGTEYAVVLFDVDHFKLYNDAAGHLAGDRVLAQVTAVMRGQARASDGLYRFGGEEFVLLAPHGGRAGAVAVAERLRRAVQALALPHPGLPPGPDATGAVVTVSAGTAASSGTCPAPADVLAAADADLYAAKRGGRNRTGAPPGPAPAR